MPKIVDHDEQRRAIAVAAIAVIDAQGLDAARLRDVAEAAAVTTGAVTHYFASKDAVLEAAMGEIVRRILDKQGEAPLPGSAIELIEFAAGFLPVDAESRRDWRVWIGFWGRAINNARLRERHRAYYQAITKRLAAQLRHAHRPSRAMSLRDARELADAIVAAIDGIGTRAALEATDWPPKRQRDTLTRLLIPLLASPRKE